jgi:hypothetical protein
MARGLFATLFLTDLDNTLFQSKWQDRAGLHPMSKTATGEDHGYASEAQAELWDAMRYEAYCLGVTARNMEQVSRVGGWNPIHEHQLMLVDHGLTLLYRDISKSNEWQPIEGWSAPYIEQARVNNRKLDKEGARLYFAMVEAMPELASKYETKLAYTTIPGSNSVNLFYSLRANAFYADAIKNNRHDQINALRNVLHRHIAASELPMTYFEVDGTFSLLPGWFSKKDAVKRLMMLLKTPEPGLDDPRLNEAVRAIGRPKLVLTAGDGLDDVAFMGLGHFMITPSKSAIASTLTEMTTDIPLLTDVA